MDKDEQEVIALEHNTTVGPHVTDNESGPSPHPASVEELLLLSMPGLLDFADRYPLYKSTLLFAYKIYRDLYLGGLYESIEVLDGLSFNVESYYFRGKVATKSTTRILIPFDFEKDVDLAWYERAFFFDFLYLHTPYFRLEGWNK